MGILRLHGGDGTGFGALLRPQQLQRRHAPAAGHAAGRRQRRGSPRLRGADGREGTVDKLALLGYAHLPDFALISLQLAVHMAQQRLRPGPARAVQPAVHDDVRHADNVLLPTHALVVRPHRRRRVGALVLLHHHHRRRPYLEIRHADICAAYNRRADNGLPRQIPQRGSADVALRHASAQRQPPADNLLLGLHHGPPGPGLPGAGHPREAHQTLARRHRRMPAVGSLGLRRQRPVAVQHLRILQGDQARAVRADAPQERRRRG